MRPAREHIRQVLHPVEAAGRLPVAGGEEAPVGRPAGVLVPLEWTDEGWRVLLTVRTAHLSTHAGQVSLPGGRQEAGDRGPVDTALRETEEETGIAADFVEVAGILDRYPTVTGFVMTPVVGFLQPGFSLRRQPEEVEELFWMPLERAVDPAWYENRSLVFRGRRRHYHAQEFQGHVVWGATAAILLGLGERLNSLQGGASADAI